MKKLAALLATAAIAITASASEGVTFNRAVTYTQPVTYTSGVTYLSEVTYAETAANNPAKPKPVLLEGLVVTPTHTYTRSEWNTKMQARYERDSNAPRTVRVHRQGRRHDWTSVLKSVTEVFN